ncbi:MAG: hypothetical protein LBH59_05745, partial [Planctomycetaceae bacterium]|nr:hypothetical protein [Planctomycetaceae bacterium]
MQKKSYFKIDNRNQIMPILLMTKILQKVIFFVVGILSFVLGKVLNFCYSNSTSFCCRFMVVIMGFGLIFGLLNFAGCSHNAVNRGHIISLEYNRPPWIGCPPDT